MNSTIQAEEYLSRSNKYWRQALELFEKGEVEKASELAWGSVAERIKGLSLIKSGNWLRSHKEVRNYMKMISSQLPDKELHQLFLVAQRLHVEFYESHLDSDDVKEALLSVEKLLTKIDFLLYS